MWLWKRRWNLRKDFDRYYRLIIIIAGILALANAARQFWPVYDPYTIVQYYLDLTHFGFVQRFVIGEIVYRILGFVIPIEKMMGIINIANLLTVLLIIAAIILITYRYVKNDDMILMLAILLVSCPVMSFFVNMTGRFEVYLILLTLLQVLFCIGNGNLTILVPLLSFLCILIHTAYLLQFFPLVVMMLAYRTFVKDDGHKRRNGFLLFFACMAVLSAFLYLQFFSFGNMRLTAREAVKLLIQREDGLSGSYQETLINDVIAASPARHLEGEFSKRINADYVLQALPALLKYIPLTIAYFMFFFNVARGYADKFKRICVMLCPFSVMAVVPLYITEYDYGRWTLGIVFQMITGMIFILITEQKKNIKCPRWFSFIVYVITLWGGVFPIVYTNIPF